MGEKLVFRRYEPAQPHSSFVKHPLGHAKCKWAEMPHSNDKQLSGRTRALDRVCVTFRGQCRNAGRIRSRTPLIGRTGREFPMQLVATNMRSDMYPGHRM